MTRANPQVTDPLEMRVVFTKAVHFEGDFDELFPAVCEDRLGFSICPVTRVKDPSKGFLEDFMKSGLLPDFLKRLLDKDFFFRVRAEIRLKLQDNERWTVSVKRKTATCTVCSTSPSKHIDI